jgi:uncharacterized protein
MSEPLTLEEQKILLRLAREALECGVRRESLPPLDPSALTATLVELGASFVTLTVGGDLRGCVGALEAYQPLVDDVREHAIAAALNDFRFHPVMPEELKGINVEVSRLTAPVPFEYQTPEELLARLRPHVDGVVLRDGARRATFLPQVWDTLPEPARFLDQLCYKMGAAPDLWRKKHLTVQIYQVEEFHE